jgi:hypothetical protein
METTHLTRLIKQAVKSSKRVFGYTAIIGGGLLLRIALSIWPRPSEAGIRLLLTGLLSILCGASVAFPTLATFVRSDPFSQLERDALIVALVLLWIGAGTILGITIYPLL